MKKTVVALASIFVLGSSFVQASENLILNGDFEEREQQYFAGWRHDGRILANTDGENTWIKLEKSFAQTDQFIEIDPSWKKLTLTCRIKLTDVVRGKKGWMVAKLAIDFQNENKKHIGPWQKSPGGVGTKDWTPHTVEMTIPAGAKYLKVAPAMFGKSGTIEVDDVKVVVSE